MKIKKTLENLIQQKKLSLTILSKRNQEYRQQIMNLVAWVIGALGAAVQIAVGGKKVNKIKRKKLVIIPKIVYITSVIERLSSRKSKTS